MQVGEAAGKVHIEPFVPRQGVQIETDPKATSINSATAMGDDEGAIEGLIQRLQVGSPRCAALLGACCSSGVVCSWHSRSGMGSSMSRHCCGSQASCRRIALAHDAAQLHLLLLVWDAASVDAVTLNSRRPSMLLLEQAQLLDCL